MENNVLVKVENLSVVLNNNTIIDRVNFSVSNNQIFTIIGPNGSGKTTLVKAIMGIVEPNQGSIIKAKGLKIGYMPQKLSLNKNIPIRVIDFLELEVQHKIQKSTFSNTVNELTLNELLNKDLRKLSGGEMQRVLLAKSLLVDPDLLILDEPISGLDINSQVEFYKLIEHLRNEKNISIILISHDLHIVMKKADYVICLNQHICCEGSPLAVKESNFFDQLTNKEAFQTISKFEHHHDHKHN